MVASRGRAAHARVLGSPESARRNARASAIPEFLNPELSLLEFQRRVSSLAEDPTYRFANDSVSRDHQREPRRILHGADVWALRGGAPDAQRAGSDGLTVEEQLAAVIASVGEITARQAVCATACFVELGRHGTHVLGWNDLDAEQQSALRARFREEIQPILTPFAMTLSPGHPLPRLMHLSLAIATILRNGPDGPPRFAEVDLPASLPRFFVVPGADGRIAGCTRRNCSGESRPAASGHDARASVRIPRHPSAELELDELRADDLLDEVSRATAQRGQGAAVRLEVERGMPPCFARYCSKIFGESTSATTRSTSPTWRKPTGCSICAGSRSSTSDDPSLGYPRLRSRDAFAGETMSSTPSRAATSSFITHSSHSRVPSLDSSVTR